MAERYDISKPIRFKTGLYNLNRQPDLNYELNRMINWSNGDLSEVQAVSHQIKNFADWKRTLISLGDTALRENRTENAIAYYRMAEFYMNWQDPDALKYYRLAKELFYSYFAGYFEPSAEGGKPLVERFEIPYENTTMPLMKVQAEGKEKGTLLLHGGYDSYMEEFLFPMLYLRRHGYRIIGRNYSCRFGEIDILAQKRGYLAIVEVKLRRSDRFATAREFVDARKQDRVRSAAELWLAENETELQPRFDVIEVYGEPGMPYRSLEIRHYENAFE